MGDGAAVSEQVLMTWPARIRVLANASVWSGMAMALGIPGVALGILVAVISKRPEYALLVPAVVLSVTFAIFILVGVVIDLFGGFQVTFVLTTDGVRSLSGKGARAASTAAVVVGVLAGSAGAAGAGLLARSEQDVFIAWKDVSKIRPNLKRRYILVKGGWADKPIGLYCTAENFDAVMRIVQDHARGRLGTPAAPEQAPA